MSPSALSFAEGNLASLQACQQAALSSLHRLTAVSGVLQVQRRCFDIVYRKVQYEINAKSGELYAALDRKLLALDEVQNRTGKTLADDDVRRLIVVTADCQVVEETIKSIEAGIEDLHSLNQGTHAVYENNNNNNGNTASSGSSTGRRTGSGGGGYTPAVGGSCMFLTPSAGTVDVTGGLAPAAPGTHDGGRWSGSQHQVSVSGGRPWEGFLGYNDSGSRTLPGRGDGRGGGGWLVFEQCWGGEAPPNHGGAEAAAPTKAGTVSVGTSPAARMTSSRYQHQQQQQQHDHHHHDRRPHDVTVADGNALERQRLLGRGGTNPPQQRTPFRLQVPHGHHPRQQQQRWVQLEDMLQRQQHQQHQILRRQQQQQQQWRLQHAQQPRQQQQSRQEHSRQHAALNGHRAPETSPRRSENKREGAEAATGRLLAGSRSGDGGTGTRTAAIPPAAVMQRNGTPEQRNSTPDRARGAERACQSVAEPGGCGDVGGVQGHGRRGENTVEVKPPAPSAPRTEGARLHDGSAAAAAPAAAPAGEAATPVGEKHDRPPGAPSEGTASGQGNRHQHPRTTTTTPKQEIGAEEGGDVKRERRRTANDSVGGGCFPRGGDHGYPKNSQGGGGGGGGRLAERATTTAAREGARSSGNTTPPSPWRGRAEAGDEASSMTIYPYFHRKRRGDGDDDEAAAALGGGGGGAGRVRPSDDPSTFRLCRRRFDEGAELGGTKTEQPDRRAINREGGVEQGGEYGTSGPMPLDGSSSSRSSLHKERGGRGWGGRWPWAQGAARWRPVVGSDEGQEWSVKRERSETQGVAVPDRVWNRRRC